jgi:hypothetical protein
MKARGGMQVPPTTADSKWTCHFNQHTDTSEYMVVASAFSDFGAPQTTGPFGHSFKQARTDIVQEVGILGLIQQGCVACYE